MFSVAAVVVVVRRAVERDKARKKGDKTEHRIMRLNRFSYNSLVFSHRVPSCAIQNVEPFESES